MPEQISLPKAGDPVLYQTNAVPDISLVIGAPYDSKYYDPFKNLAIITGRSVSGTIGVLGISRSSDLNQTDQMDTLGVVSCLCFLLDLTSYVGYGIIL